MKNKQACYISISQNLSQVHNILLFTMLWAKAQNLQSASLLVFYRCLYLPKAPTFFTGKRKKKKGKRMFILLKCHVSLSNDVVSFEQLGPGGCIIPFQPGN